VLRVALTCLCCRRQSKETRELLAAEGRDVLLLSDFDPDDPVVREHGPVTIFYTEVAKT
jgi:hypothetical protein